jgi:two-component system NtrC family sensor kinase
MEKEQSKRTDSPGAKRNLTEGDRTGAFRVMARQILEHAGRGTPRVEFLREFSQTLLETSGCDDVDIRLREDELHTHCETVRRTRGSFRIEVVPCGKGKEEEGGPRETQTAGSERLCRDIILGRLDSTLPCFTKSGSFWTGDLTNPFTITPRPGEPSQAYPLEFGEGYRSLAMIPLEIGDESFGLLQLLSRQPDFFTRQDVEFCEEVAQLLSITLVLRRSQLVLRERVKELTCLHRISKIAERPDASLDEILQSIVELLPAAWQYPDIAEARILLDGRAFTTKHFREGADRQAAPIVVGGRKRGAVELVYTAKRPSCDEGPFLREERSLIDGVAHQVVNIIERKKVEDDKMQLQQQLMHADRLATIGQMAAGVAHELNEPLGTVLGFAQLGKKCADLPEQAAKDFDTIVQAALHAREVIRKLMIFARQVPPRKTHLDMNRLVKEGLYYFETRCAKEGVELKVTLAPDLPRIYADPAQLNQVLINLVVNALQAMPDGGTLTVQTSAGDGRISLIVEDTGVGMSEEVCAKIFVPFFTTKDVDQGTGLGLAVVDSIVASHKGSIQVDSRVGRGSRFEIQLPVSGPKEK